MCKVRSYFQSQEAIRSARKQVLDFFGAYEDDYALVFTSGATHAIRMVGEALLRQSGCMDLTPHLSYARECHTSLVGLRELCAAAGGKVQVLSSDELEEKVEEDSNSSVKLLAFPAMSNFCGRKFPSKEIVDRWRKKVLTVIMSFPCLKWSLGCLLRVCRTTAISPSDV